MNGAVLHLAFNHIPVIGVPFCFLLLWAGVARKSRELAGTGFVFLILVALLSVVAFRSGGPAAKLIHDLPGITRQTIHEHAEAAEDGFWAVEALGVAGIIGLWLLKKRGSVPQGWTILTLLGAVAVSGWMAWIAHLGGLIRHPEIASDYKPAIATTAPAAVPAAAPKAKDADDD